MVREFSAGGVVLRRMSGGGGIAAIEAEKEESETPPARSPGTRRRRVPRKTMLALPKGLVDPGEKPEETALREVQEETGLISTPVTKLGDIKYVYVRSWGD